MEFSSSQIRSLASDAVSFAASEKIARQKWAATGRSTRAVWGEIAGSGKNPYQVRVDLRAFAYRCSCPSRKLPCKHVLGLLLRIANAFSGTFDAPEPGWVVDWLADRDDRAAKKAAKEDRESSTNETERDKKNADQSKDSLDLSGKSTSQSADSLAKKTTSSSQTSARRNKRVAEGLTNLQRWLADLTRGGFAELEQKPYSFWNEEAKRLTDAQAGGAAALVSSCSEISGTGRKRTERLLGRLGKIALLTEAFSRLDFLPDELAADVRSSLGWSAQKAEVFRNGERVVDRWISLGRRRQNGLRVETERNWFWGETSRRFLLYLQFSVGRSGYPEAFLPGVVCEKTASFAPSAAPFRAFFAPSETDVPTISPTGLARLDATQSSANWRVTLNGFAKKTRNIDERPASERIVETQYEPILPDDAAETIPEFLERYSQILARSPWTETVPVLLRDVAIRPFNDSTASGGKFGWNAVDSSERAVPIAGLETFDFWRLVALSAERPVALFGEWRGEFLAPISIWNAGRLTALVGNDVAF